jgi:hypothetical protein
MTIKRLQHIEMARKNGFAQRLGRTIPYPDKGIATDADLEYVRRVRSRTLAIYNRMKKTSSDGTFPMVLALVMGEIEITQELQSD